MMAEFSVHSLRGGIHGEMATRHPGSLGLGALSCGKGPFRSVVAG